MEKYHICLWCQAEFEGGVPHTWACHCIKEHLQKEDERIVECRVCTIPQADIFHHFVQNHQDYCPFCADKMTAENNVAHNACFNAWNVVIKSFLG